MLNFLKNIISSKTIKEPIFVKDLNEMPDYLTNLIELEKKITSEKKYDVTRDINIIKEGINGEKQVAIEIENSKIPMLILHDVRIPMSNSTLEFDYILITHKCIYILDTKTLAGKITVDNKGNFLREFDGKKFFMYDVEDINSIVKDNEENKKILIKFLKATQIIEEYPIKNYLVLTDEKSVINTNELALDGASRIVKIENLIDKILRVEGVHKKEKNEEIMNSISDFMISNSEKKQWDFMRYYELTDDDFKESIDYIDDESNCNGIEEEYSEESHIDMTSEV